MDEGINVLEIGTGTGYSTGLLCHRLGEDNVTSVEVDPAVSERADQSLEAAGYSTWTVTGDGLLGHPRRASYDRTIATCAVRRIPYAWVRQTKPGGIILATVGPSVWSYGTGLAKLIVKDDGTAEGRIIGRTSFMPARAEASVPFSGDLSARTAYADIERKTSLSPGVLNDWMPAFLAQLAAHRGPSSCVPSATAERRCTCSTPTAKRSPRSPQMETSGPYGRAGQWPSGTPPKARSPLGRTQANRTSALSA